MEITKREILFCSIIIAVMVGLGLWISNPIISSVTQDAEKIVSAVQVKDSAKFDYIMRTNVGDFIGEGMLYTVDPVSIPDIEGQYGKIEKLTQEYEMEMRVVTTEDEKGNIHTHTETYWEWNTKKREEWEATAVKFLGKTFKPKDILFKYCTSYYKTIEAPKQLFHDDVRYVYYVAPSDYQGTLTGIADNKSFSELRFKNGNTIQKTIERAMSNIKGTPIGFWIFWGLLTIGASILFCYFENKWLY